MSSLNKVLLIGNVGKAPEIKGQEGANKVAIITLATSERYTDRSGEKKEETEWHTVVAYGRLADVTERFIKKGSLLFIDGKIRTRKWTDRDGGTRYSTEVLASNIQMLNKIEEAAPQMDADDDLPEFFK